MGVITEKQLLAKASIKDAWLIEDGPRGAGRFVARLTPSGERLFYYRYTDSKGDRVRLPLGSYDPNGAPGLTLKQARTKADELATLYIAGHRDLREFLAQQKADELAADQRQRQQAEETQAKAELERQRRLTVRQVFERLASVELTSHVRADGKRVGRKDGGKYTREQFERHIFPRLGDVALIDVRKSDVLGIIDTIKAAGKLRTCNVLLADLKQMMRFAVAREVIPFNPLETVTKRDAGGADVERERVLNADELKALVKLLPQANMGKRSERAVWLILGTGCRVGELMGARWEHVDLQAQRWHLPTTKNQRPHTIHLSSFALAHFEALAALRENDKEGKPTPWVFPNSAVQGPVDSKTFGKQLADRQRQGEARLSGRSKHTDALHLTGGRWTAHDLRRTAATLMAELGISGDTIDECLNHVIESRVRRTYIRDRRLAEQSRAFDALGQWLESLNLEGLYSNVMPIRSAA
jgi:integrase